MKSQSKLFIYIHNYQKLFGLMFTTTVLLSLAACRQSFSTPQSAPILQIQDDGRTTISFAVRDDERDIYTALAEKFMAETPELRVAIVSSDELLTDFLAQNATPTSLDQARWTLEHADTTFAGDLSEMSSHKLILDLNSLAAADASFDRDDFYPGMLEQYSTANSLWAIPRFRAVELLKYNKTLFKEQNVPFPKPGSTWNEIFDTAKQLAQTQGETISVYGILDFLNSEHLLTQRLTTAGLELGSTPDNSVDLTQVGLEPEIEQMRQMQDNGTLLLSSMFQPHIPSVDYAALRRESKLAMWGSSDFYAQAGKDGVIQPEELSFEVGTSAFPAEQRFFANAGEGYIISAGTAYPQAAWQWINFLSRQPITMLDDMRPDSGPSVVPARKSVAETLKFWEDYDLESQQAALWTLAHAPGEADRPREVYVLSNIGMLAYDVFTKPNLSARELLAEAQQQLERELAQVALTPTPKQSNEPLVVATPQPEMNAEGRTTITFGIYGRSPSDLQQLAERFHEQQPDVFVNLSQATAPGGNGTSDALASANDCFFWSGTPPDPAATLDLAPLINADAAFARDDYPSLLLAPYQAGDAIHGLPLTVRFRALHFNQDAFGSIGNTMPSADWTTDDFLRVAQAGTSGNGKTKQYGYIPYSGVIPDLLFFIHQRGGRLFTGTAANPRPTITDAKVIDAVNWYLDLDRVHHVTSPFATLVNDQGGASEVAMQLVRSGRATTWLGDSFRSVIPPQGESAPFEEGLAPLPIGQAGFGSSDLYLQSLHISAQTVNVQACWRWLTFLSQDASMAGWPGVLPARQSVARSVRLPEQASKEDVDLFNSYAQLATQASPMIDVVQLDLQSPTYQWFFQAIQDIILENANVEEQLANAQSQTEAYLACIKDGGSEKTCTEQTTP